MNDQRFNQGRSQKQLDRTARNGGISCMAAVIWLIICLLWMTFSCSQKQYRYNGPKEYKTNYIMPQYLRITDYYK